MEKKDRIHIEITENTIKYLLYQFDQLLLGIDTNKYAFGDQEEKEDKIKGIKNFANYRIKENIVEPSSELGQLLREIQKKDFSEKEEAERILLKLINLSVKRAMCKF